MLSRCKCCSCNPIIKPPTLSIVNKDPMASLMSLQDCKRQSAKQLITLKNWDWITSDALGRGKDWKMGMFPQEEKIPHPLWQKTSMWLVGGRKVKLILACWCWLPYEKNQSWTPMSLWQFSYSIRVSSLPQGGRPVSAVISTLAKLCPST